MNIILTTNKGEKIQSIYTNPKQIVSGEAIKSSKQPMLSNVEDAILELEKSDLSENEKRTMIKAMREFKNKDMHEEDMAIRYTQSTIYY